MKAAHQMKIDERSFSRVKAGEKTLELRLYDDKRRRLNPGDEIEFVRFPSQTEKQTVIVTGLLRYDSFADLLADTPSLWLGCDEVEKQKLARAMYQIYTPEEEAEFGVLGIRFKKSEK